MTGRNYSDAEILAARMRIVCDEFFGRPVSEELRVIAGHSPIDTTESWPNREERR